MATPCLSITANDFSSSSSLALAKRLAYMRMRRARGVIASFEDLGSENNEVELVEQEAVELWRMENGEWRIEN